MKSFFRYFAGFWILLLAGCMALPENSQPTRSGDDRENRSVLPKVLPQEFASYKPAIESSKKPYIRIDLQRSPGLDMTSSKFRGTPYIEKNQEYPKDKDGKPLTLLAQINFADMPEYQDFPKRGILQFYIQPREGKTHVLGMNIYDAQPWIHADYLRSLHRQDYFRVIYHPEIKEAKKPNEIPRHHSDGMPINQEIALNFKLDAEYISPDDYQFKKYFGSSIEDFHSKHQGVSDDKFEQFHDYLSNLVPAKIGGYGRFVQSDPRSDANQDDWIILLNIESTNIPGGGEILWGDAGIATFLIRKQDLAKRDFSNVAYYWDNH
jgi:uncharacterized protein YwqG